MGRAKERKRTQAPARGPSPGRAHVPAPFLSPWLAAGPLALVLAFVAARGAPLGTPIADDYAFLARLTLHRPLDWLGSMGAAFYWRPLARQLYFSVFGPSMIAAPWVTVVFHAALFLALFALAWDLARRVFAAPVAAAIATFPVLSETTRMLLYWPSAAQHLLAMVFAALALREARAGRAWTTGLAVIAGLLCHEAALIALPFAVLLLLHDAPRETRARWLRVAPPLAMFALWAVVYRVVQARGVLLPTRPPGAASPGGYLQLLGFATPALLNLEDIGGTARAAIEAGYVVIAAWAGMLLFGAAGRRRFVAARPALALGAAWFALGLAPLLAVLDDWNAWRTPMPGLGFGLLALGLVGVASPRLALAFAGLRAVALLLAPAAPTTVAPFQPVTTSEMSFTRLVRLQRIADDTRTTLAANYPRLPAHADVRFQTLPRMAEVGLQGQLAPRVWYADSTLTWRSFGGLGGFDPMPKYVLAYDTHRRWKPVVLAPEAVSLLGRGLAAMAASRLAEADSLLVAAQEAQAVESDEFSGSVVANRARIALAKNDIVHADSLNQVFLVDVGPVADYFGLQAAVHLMRGQRDQAERDLVACFGREPRNATGLAVQAAMGKASAAAR